VLAGKVTLTPRRRRRDLAGSARFCSPKVIVTGGSGGNEDRIEI
jgi:hypothetical protein